MGGARLRSAHTERRCAGGVGGAGLAGGEMSEDPLDDLGSVDSGDDAQRAATHTTVFDVDVEDALEALHAAHGGRRRMGFAGGLMSTVGDDVVAVYEVRGEQFLPCLVRPTQPVRMPVRNVAPGSPPRSCWYS